MTTPRLAPLPRTRARTSAQLFRALYRVLRTEPRRLRVEATVTQFRTPHWDPRAYEGADPPGRPPPCGTVACYGGWLHLLLEGLYGADLPEPRGVDLCRLARWLAGKSAPLRAAIMDLFWNLRPFDRLRYGTPAYSRLALQLLRDFLRRHGPALGRHWLPGRRPRRAGRLARKGARRGG